MESLGFSSWPQLGTLTGASSLVTNWLKRYSVISLVSCTDHSEWVWHVWMPDREKERGRKIGEGGRSEGGGDMGREEEEWGGGDMGKGRDRSWEERSGEEGGETAGRELAGAVRRGAESQSRWELEEERVILLQSPGPSPGPSLPILLTPAHPFWSSHLEEFYAKLSFCEQVYLPSYSKPEPLHWDSSSFQTWNCKGRNLFWLLTQGLKQLCSNSSINRHETPLYSHAAMSHDQARWMTPPYILQRDTVCPP